MYRLYRKMTIYGHLSIRSIRFGDPLLTVLYSKLCYNKECCKEVSVYLTKHHTACGVFFLGLWFVSSQLLADSISLDFLH